MRGGTVSLIGQVLFVIGLMALWVANDFMDTNMPTIVIGAVFVAIGLPLTIVGDRQDIEKFKRENKAAQGLLPPAGIGYIGVVALTLGLLGVVLIALDSAWDNTIWVVLELGSIALGAVLTIWGRNLDKQRQMQSSEPSGPTL